MQMTKGTLLRSILLFLPLFGASVFSVTGCKPSAEKIAAREALITQEIESVFGQAQELQSQGRLDDALALIEKGLNNPTYKAQQARFFTQRIDLLLAQNNDAKASEFALQTWQSAPELARDLAGRIHSYYQQKNDGQQAVGWCKRLLALGDVLPADFRVQVLDWQLTSVIALHDVGQASACFDSIQSTLKPGEAAPLLQRALASLADTKQLDFSRELLAHMEKRNDESPLYRNLIVTSKMRLALVAEEWNTFAPVFNACVAQLPDDQLLSVLRTVFSTLQKAKKDELTEQSSKHVIFNAAEKKDSVNYAARIWTESGVASDKKLLPERLEALLNAKVSPVQVGNLFDRYFYEMVSDLSVIRSLCTVGEHILAVCTDENTVNNVKVKILDGAFITDNFDLAVHMLEQGIPGKDKAWHEMSLPKVKAHRALAQKKPREAVQYFRDFMNAWLTSPQEEEFDPTSGIAYSREWILGRNANRIAGILDSIPDKAAADQARAEAKAYFKTAIEKASKDAEATKLIKEETKGMGL